MLITLFRIKFYALDSQHLKNRECLTVDTDILSVIAPFIANIDSYESNTVAMVVDGCEKNNFYD